MTTDFYRRRRRGYMHILFTESVRLGVFHEEDIAWLKPELINIQNEFGTTIFDLCAVVITLTRRGYPLREIVDGLPDFLTELTADESEMNRLYLQEAKWSVKEALASEWGLHAILRVIATHIHNHDEVAIEDFAKTNVSMYVMLLTDHIESTYKSLVTSLSIQIDNKNHAFRFYRGLCMPVPGWLRSLVVLERHHKHTHGQTLERLRPRDIEERLVVSVPQLHRPLVVHNIACVPDVLIEKE